MNEPTPVLRLVVSENQSTQSEYDHLNVYLDNQFVGKIRGKLGLRTITIHSITIFPEFQAHGYGKLVIEKMQETFNTIVADRVRFSAIGFWEKMGFTARPDGSYEYRRKT